MTGTIIPRGKKSWRLKFDVDRDPVTGKRTTRYHTFRGTKKAAEAELIRLLSGVQDGSYVDPSKVTVSEFLDQWEPNQLSPKTRERYQDLIKTHIRPRIGHIRLQKLGAVALNELYAALLREGRGTEATPLPLAPRTVGHVHRVLHRALRDAVKGKLLKINPASDAEPPAVEEDEIEILEEHEVRTVLERLRGRAMFLLVALALATGARRGELCALRWSDIDLDKAELTIERALEQTKAGLRFKPPKTKSGRRKVSLPSSVIPELRAHWKAQQEQRLALGLGKDDPDALVFRRHDGSPLIPNSVTTEWRRNVVALKLPAVSFHALRHTHVSQLIKSNKLDILTISRRIGHRKASITLDVYGHLFKGRDEESAAVFDAAYAGTFRD